MPKLQKPYRSALRLVPLLVGIVLSVISVVIIIQLLIPAERRLPATFAGLDIVYNCPSRSTAFVGLTPISDLPDVHVIVLIENWKELSDNCTEIQVYFPGFTYGHMYLVEAELSENPIMSSEEWQALTYEATRVPLSSHMELIWDPLFSQHIIRIKPQQLVDFAGAIEFAWIDGSRNIAYARRGIFLPFQAPMPAGAQVNTVQNYTLAVWCPTGYDLALSRPEPSRFQLLADRGYYLFNIDTNKTDFYAVFENDNLSRKMNYLLILFSTLLGIGLALTVEEAMAFIKTKISKTV